MKRAIFNPNYLQSNPFLNPETNFSGPHTNLLKTYLSLDVDDYINFIQTTSEDMMFELGQQKALNLFYQAAQYVPAYRDFLRKNHIKPNSIQTFADYQQVPRTDKPTYIDKYDLKDLCWHGNLSSSNIIAFSSGSTNQPHLWPRGLYQDLEGAFTFEHLLTHLFHIRNQKTLFVNCFSMGNYVAGLYVYTSVKLLSQKGYPITIVSPGINYEDIFAILNPLKDHFEQIIVAGYPPFIREVVELGISKKIPFKKINLKFFFASEFFSENWREQTLNLTGTRNSLKDSTNIYGTADSAIFSFETPTSILIKKLTTANPDLNQALFHTSIVPTLTQYNPLQTLYESFENELTLTANAGIPLLRYSLKDQGNILSNKQIDSTLKRFHINLNKELSEKKLTKSRHNLPFVYLTNRTDGAVSFYGIKIYPSYVRSGLESPQLVKKLTGKFMLNTTINQNNIPTLIIHLELASNTKPSQMLSKLAAKQVRMSLRNNCAEYAFLESSLGNKAYPEIKLHQHGDKVFFQPAIKQKWVQT